MWWHRVRWISLPRGALVRTCDCSGSLACAATMGRAQKRARPAQHQHSALSLLRSALKLMGQTEALGERRLNAAVAMYHHVTPPRQRRRNGDATGDRPARGLGERRARAQQGEVCAAVPHDASCFSRHSCASFLPPLCACAHKMVHELSHPLRFASNSFETEVKSSGKNAFVKFLAPW